MKSETIAPIITAGIDRAFSLDGYAALIRGFLDAGYKFIFFDGAPAQPQTIIMRHDIDFDLAQARALAQREQALGIKSTYFFLVRTELYNIFSKDGSNHIRSIIDMGHDIGVHFDTTAYADQSSDSLRAGVQQEMKMLADWFGIVVKALSFHRPNPAVLADGAGEITKPYLHAYQDIYTKHRVYFSDAQGLWRFGHPFDSDAFKSGAPLQILTHPIWWRKGEAGNSYETLTAFLDTRSEELARQTALHCKTFRRGKYADIKD